MSDILSNAASLRRPPVLACSYVLQISREHIVSRPLIWALECGANFDGRSAPAPLSQEGVRASMTEFERLWWLTLSPFPRVQNVWSGPTARLCASRHSGQAVVKKRFSQVAEIRS